MDTMYNIKERRSKYADHLENLKEGVRNSASGISRVSLKEYFSYGISKIEKEVIDAELSGIATCYFYDAEIKELGKLEKTLSVIKTNEQVNTLLMRVAYDSAFIDLVIEKLEEIKTMKRNKGESLEAFYERKSAQIDDVLLRLVVINKSSAIVEAKKDVAHSRIDYINAREDIANHYRKKLNLNEITSKEAYEKCLSLLEKEYEFATRVNRPYAETYFSYDINRIKENTENAENEGNDTDDFYNKQIDFLLYMHSQYIKTLKKMNSIENVEPLEVRYGTQMEFMYDIVGNTLPISDDRTIAIYKKLREISTTKEDEGEIRDDECYRRQLDRIPEVMQEIAEIVTFFEKKNKKIK